MYQLTSSFYRANLEKKIPSRLQAEGTLGVNGVTSMIVSGLYGSKSLK